jgi:16S rRNA G966 N2-methylase RsmD
MRLIGVNSNIFDINLMNCYDLPECKGKGYDIVYCDLPYSETYKNIYTLLANLINKNWLNSDKKQENSNCEQKKFPLIIVEHAKSVSICEKLIENIDEIMAQNNYVKELKSGEGGADYGHFVKFEERNYGNTTVTFLQYHKQ